MFQLASKNDLCRLLLHNKYANNLHKLISHNKYLMKKAQTPASDPIVIAVRSIWNKDPVIFNQERESIWNAVTVHNRDFYDLETKAFDPTIPQAERDQARKALIDLINTDRMRAQSYMALRIRQAIYEKQIQMTYEWFRDYRNVGREQAERNLYRRADELARSVKTALTLAHYSDDPNKVPIEDMINAYETLYKRELPRMREGGQGFLERVTSWWNSSTLTHKIAALLGLPITFAGLMNIASGDLSLKSVVFTGLGAALSAWALWNFFKQEKPELATPDNKELLRLIGAEVKEPPPLPPELSEGRQRPTGGATPTAPPGGATPTAPPGGATPTAPPGGATPTAPPGGATPTAPPGGATPTAPPGGATPAPTGGVPPQPDWLSNKSREEILEIFGKADDQLGKILQSHGVGISEQMRQDALVTAQKISPVLTSARNNNRISLGELISAQLALAEWNVKYPGSLQGVDLSRSSKIIDDELDKRESALDLKKSPEGPPPPKPLEGPTPAPTGGSTPTAPPGGAPPQTPRGVQPQPSGEMPKPKKPSRQPNWVSDENLPTIYAYMMQIKKGLDEILQSSDRKTDEELRQSASAAAQELQDIITKMESNNNRLSILDSMAIHGIGRRWNARHPNNRIDVDLEHLGSIIDTELDRIGSVSGMPLGPAAPPPKRMPIPPEPVVPSPKRQPTPPKSAVPPLGRTPTLPEPVVPPWEEQPPESPIPPSDIELFPRNYALRVPSIEYRSFEFPNFEAEYPLQIGDLIANNKYLI